MIRLTSVSLDNDSYQRQLLQQQLWLVILNNNKIKDHDKHAFVERHIDAMIIKIIYNTSVL